MNRRNLLKSLAAMPFVGWLAPLAKSSGPTVSPPDPVVTTLPQEWHLFKVFEDGVLEGRLGRAVIAVPVRANTYYRVPNWVEDVTIRPEAQYEKYNASWWKSSDEEYYRLCPLGDGWWNGTGRLS